MLEDPFGISLILILIHALILALNFKGIIREVKSLIAKSR